MKLSNDFTLFGLNIKAIQSHLKEQAKDQRGIRVTRRGDLVYIMTPHTAFKLPAMLYPDIIQPVTLRECPADGVTIVSAQYGFEVDEHAPDLVDIFKSAACKEKTVQRTPSQGAWQRQLNDNGKYAAHRVMEVLDGQQ